MIKNGNVFGILFVGISMISFAQQPIDSVKVQQLDEVVITDSRFELKRENSGKTVIKISKKEIEKNQGKTISELILSLKRLLDDLIILLIALMHPLKKSKN